jgi:hypothetical protein
MVIKVLYFFPASEIGFCEIWRALISRETLEVIEHSRAQQSTAQQSTAEHRAPQSRAQHSKSEHSKPEHNRAE